MNPEWRISQNFTYRNTSCTGFTRDQEHTIQERRGNSEVQIFRTAKQADEKTAGAGPLLDHAAAFGDEKGANIS